MGKEVLLKKEKVRIVRTEANFDRACDSARKLAVMLLGIENDRTFPPLEEHEKFQHQTDNFSLKFVGYELNGGGINGGEHVYTFSATWTRNPKADDDEES